MTRKTSANFPGDLEVDVLDAVAEALVLEHGQMLVGVERRRAPVLARHLGVAERELLARPLVRLQRLEAARRAVRRRLHVQLGRAAARAVVRQYGHGRDGGHRRLGDRVAAERRVRDGRADAAEPALRALESLLDHLHGSRVRSHATESCTVRSSAKRFTNHGNLHGTWGRDGVDSTGDAA